MTLLTLLFLIYLPVELYSQVVSSMPSTFHDVTTPNTHLFIKGPSFVILRGGAPANQADLESLINFGIKRFLIVKNENRDEVSREIIDLKRLGVDDNQIVHIPLRWKDFNNYKKQCQMTIKILSQIEESVTKSESLFFHCTVGEDRTGYIAALFSLWNETSSSKHEAFKRHMCAYGYEGSNPKKPLSVVKNISAYLTPLYEFMWDLLEESKRRRLRLDEIECPDRAFHPDFFGGRYCAL